MDEVRVNEALAEVERYLSQVAKSRAIQANLERKLRSKLALAREAMGEPSEPPPVSA